MLAVRPRLASWESGYVRSAALNSVTRNAALSPIDIGWDATGILDLAGLNGVSISNDPNQINSL